MNEQRHTRWWIPIPAWSVAVRWCADAESELDALELAVLALVRNAPRTIDDLVERLGLGDDVVLSALLDLADLGLIAPPGSAASRWQSVIDFDFPGAELRSGSAFITVHGGFRSVPRVDVQPTRDHRPPEDIRDCIIDRALVRDVQIDRPVLRDVVDALARGVARGAMLCPAGNARGGEEAWGPVSLVRLDPLDAQGERDRWRRTVVWAAVDVLAGLGGDATLVFHEPDLDPCMARDTPVSTALGEWVLRHATGLAAELDRRVRELAIDRSVVLRAAGMNSIEALDEAVHQHREELAARLGFTLPPAWPAPLASAMGRLHEASRWLLIVRREPLFRDALARCLAAAVEALAQSLWQTVRDDLGAWAELWRPRLDAGGPWRTEKRLRFSAEAAARRLAEFELGDRLGASREHLLSGTADVTGTLKSIERGEPGAGTSVSLWLLPLTLLELDDARPHAARVHRALEVDPHLFNHLDALIDARNVIVHLREPTPGGLEERTEDMEAILLRVAVAVARGAV